MVRSVIARSIRVQYSDWPHQERGYAIGSLESCTHLRIRHASCALYCPKCDEVRRFSCIEVRRHGHGCMREAATSRGDRIGARHRFQVSASTLTRTMSATHDSCCGARRAQATAEFRDKKALVRPADPAAYVHLNVSAQRPIRRTTWSVPLPDASQHMRRQRIRPDPCVVVVPVIAHYRAAQGIVAHEPQRLLCAFFGGFKRQIVGARGE